MRLLRPTPLLGLVCVALLGAAVGVFALAVPRSHGSRQDAVQLDLTYAVPPVAAGGAAGWRWPGGEPGFQFGRDEKSGWNVSKLHPDELVRARAAAERAGVAPDSIRVLNVLRTGFDRLMLIVSGTDTAGETCVGVAVPDTPARFYCPRSAGSERLGAQAGFVIVDPQFWKMGHRRMVYPLFLLGIARGDVTRVTVSQPGYTHTLYRHEAGAWGTFMSSYAPAYGPTNASTPPAYRTLAATAPKQAWRGRLDFYGAKGLIGTLSLRLDRPVGRVFAVRST
jgi:hypothetical protein